MPVRCRPLCRVKFFRRQRGRHLVPPNLGVDTLLGWVRSGSRNGRTTGHGRRPGPARKASPGTALCAYMALLGRAGTPVSGLRMRLRIAVPPQSAIGVLFFGDSATNEKKGRSINTKERFLRSTLQPNRETVPWSRKNFSCSPFLVPCSAQIIPCSLS